VFLSEGLQVATLISISKTSNWVEAVYEGLSQELLLEVEEEPEEELPEDEEDTESSSLELEEELDVWDVSLFCSGGSFFWRRCFSAGGFSFCLTCLSGCNRSLPGLLFCLGTLGIAIFLGGSVSVSMCESDDSSSSSELLSSPCCRVNPLATGALFLGTCFDETCLVCAGGIVSHPPSFSASLASLSEAFIVLLTLAT